MNATPDLLEDLDGREPATGGSRAEIAYRRLKTAIESREFRPGQRMREAELAAWLGISRTPVRDALKQLESDGLLVAAPRRGLAIAELDQQQVSEIYALREILEGLAARLAARHASGAEVATLRDLVDRHAEAADAEAETHAQINRHFHQLIYRAARNRYLLGVLESLESSLALLPGTTYSAPGRNAEALQEHREILEAIERHEADRAESAARTHIQAAERIRLRMLAGPRDAPGTAAIGSGRGR
jgi:DNA-binding GntR family transcriptional regulator